MLNDLPSKHIETAGDNQIEDNLIEIPPKLNETTDKIQNEGNVNEIYAELMLNIFDNPPDWDLYEPESNQT